MAIGEDAPPSYGMHLSWTSVRLWEQDANQLVRDLPLELLGLSMCGAPGPSAREEILGKALWRLRKLEQRAAFERCLIPLVAMARVWIPDGQLVPIVERAHKRFLHRKYSGNTLGNTTRCFMGTSSSSLRSTSRTCRARRSSSGSWLVRSCHVWPSVFAG